MDPENGGVAVGPEQGEQEADMTGTIEQRLLQRAFSDASKTTMDVFFVNQFSQTGGETIWGIAFDNAVYHADPEIDDLPNQSFIRASAITSHRALFTPAHEIGHLLELRHQFYFSPGGDLIPLHHFLMGSGPPPDAHHFRVDQQKRLEQSEWETMYNKSGPQAQPLPMLEPILFSSG